MIAREDCPFCQIVDGTDRAQVVYETAETLAFFPLQPASTGHTLVIPKRHVPDLWGVDQTLVEPLFSAALVVSRGLRATLHPEGLNLISSAGPAASQTVFHLHVHIVPRWQHDRIGPIWPPPDLSIEQITPDLAERVREACGSIG